MAPTTPSPDAVTALRTALGIEVPLLGAPMARIAGGRLAAAVSEAGGLGFLGAATATSTGSTASWTRSTRPRWASA